MGFLLSVLPPRTPSCFIFCMYRSLSSTVKPSVPLPHTLLNFRQTNSSGMPFFSLEQFSFFCLPSPPRHGLEISYATLAEGRVGCNRSLFSIIMFLSFSLLLAHRCNQQCHDTACTHFELTVIKKTEPAQVPYLPRLLYL